MMMLYANLKKSSERNFFQEHALITRAGGVVGENRIDENVDISKNTLGKFNNDNPTTTCFEEIDYVQISFYMYPYKLKQVKTFSCLSFFPFYTFIVNHKQLKERHNIFISL